MRAVRKLVWLEQSFTGRGRDGGDKVRDLLAQESSVGLCEDFGFYLESNRQPL